MTTANQCEAYAAEYQARGTAPDISIQRATALMSISQSWTTLAGQLDRLAQIIKDEDEEGGLVERLVRQLDGLVASGNTVVVVEHDMSIVAASDWIIDIGPGAGDEGGKIVAFGSPETIVALREGRTAAFLERAMRVNR